MPPAATSATIEALDALAQRLMVEFSRAGYERIAPAVIQPAGLFLDVIGESLRGRTYVFTDPDGEELCLRPDLTVPTCRWHLERNPGGNAPARYCYTGSAFRYQPGSADKAHPREFRQAGIESFAHADREQDDAQTLALIAAALRGAGVGSIRTRIGDLGLFNSVVAAVPMPERWRRRLRHQFWRPDAFRAELQRLTTGPAALAHGLPRALLDVLDPDDPAGAEARVEQYLESAGIDFVGSRTVPEMTERLLAAAADLRQEPLSGPIAELIDDFTGIKTPARLAAGKIGRLVARQGIDLSAGLEAFQRRLDLLEEAGVDTADMEFSAEFGRNLEYYTGFVFEIIAPALGPASPVAGGGRYDSLLAAVGAAGQVAAVGACIHTERLLAVRQGAAP
jgi:ATP phosphoribosyltransferase regulatory subunit